MVDNFHRQAKIIGSCIFPFPVQRHIPKICRRLHFQIFCTFAHTLPLSLRKKNVLAFCSFRDYHSPYLLSIFGVLGAEALNKPTAKQVGKKVYFFCTCVLIHPYHSVNPIQAIRLLLSKQARCDFLHDTDIGIILKKSK